MAMPIVSLAIHLDNNATLGYFDIVFQECLHFNLSDKFDLSELII